MLPTERSAHPPPAPLAHEIWEQKFCNINVHHNLIQFRSACIPAASGRCAGYVVYPATRRISPSCCSGNISSSTMMVNWWPQLVEWWCCQRAYFLNSTAAADQSDFDASRRCYIFWHDGQLIAMYVNLVSVAVKRLISNDVDYRNCKIQFALINKFRLLRGRELSCCCRKQWVISHTPRWQNWGRQMRVIITQQRTTWRREVGENC